VSDRHAFQRQLTGEVRPHASKKGQSSPPAAVRSVNGDDSRPRRQLVLPKHGKNAKFVVAWISSGESRIKPVARSFGFETQPFEFAARPADDVEVNPLQGLTQGIHSV
jgi:hypothetical protein